MKVTVSVGGKFHAFDLARELFKKGALQTLITSYPKFAVKKYGIPPEKVRSVLRKELIERGWNKLPHFLKFGDPQFFINDLFDRKASSLVERTDIFVGWANQSLRTLRRAKEWGAVGIIERGSSHIEYQRDILKEEYERFGVKPELPHPKIVEKELKEYEEADYISIPSLFVKRTFLEKGIPGSKLIHVPYGVDLARFKQVPKTDDVFRVVFVGGMSIRKGVHYLLRAFSELKLPDAELLLIGGMNDEMRPFFQKYGVERNANLRMRANMTNSISRINYFGHVPQAELYKYYSQGSVFTMMSIEEGLSMVVPQAMACGLPVIATTNTGAEDIVRNGEDGFIIPIRDVEKLKERLIYLYEHPEECMAMGRSAKDRVASGFTWDDYGEKMMNEYGKMLRGGAKDQNL